MPYIFRFHKGRNNNIIDWKASDKILSADVGEVLDKTNILRSSAGTSIPTPIARMFLFKTAFEIVAAQIRNNKLDKESIYAGLVSETLDLLELLYKSGSDEGKFRYHKWLFDNSQHNDDSIFKFFGQQHGHKLLAESFKQAASQPPFNNKIQLTLIYYREGSKEILIGGTSPFTFVFTSPNFIRKLKERNFKAIAGLVSNDVLFDAHYKQLHERDEAFIKYVESLVSSLDINPSFAGITEYVTNTRNKYFHKFNGSIASLQDIQFADIPLSVSNITLKQITEQDYRQKINQYSDFKVELPADSNYKDALFPLFLLDKMAYDGNYTSSASPWSPATRVLENEYPETTIDEIKTRELPGLSGFTYPFLSSFDFFERSLISLPGYALNPERFLTLTDKQTFIYPIKPLFFHFFPIAKMKDYISMEIKGEHVTFSIKVPVHGASKGRREFVCKKTYDASSTIKYSGIIGIFPFTKTTQRNLLHINKYTVASYEKTNEPLLLDSIGFIKKTGVDQIHANPVPRANYDALNTKTTYFQLNESFDLIRLNFLKDNSACGGIIIPKFREVENGTEAYVYAIDFGTSNTHVEYGRVVNDKVTETFPFTVDEKSMQMVLLNKPREVVINDGAERYNDYKISIGTVIDSAGTITLREFVPLQIGPQPAASSKFPFRTATCESENFIKNYANNRLFIDANIGFNIDTDSLQDKIRYKTDLKWLLERSGNDQFNINRVTLFFRELLLMIRTKVLLESTNLRGDISRLKIAVSLPISMGPASKNQLLDIIDAQRLDVLGENSLPLREVTESIAPYYQLRYINTNIQNDSYCNIDVGGGTTDIVLINKSPVNFNELYCYCSSFKFAGRQLWSSGSNEFNNSDNGFVAYYKRFIEQKNVNVYRELQRVLNSSSNRTEDLVSLLFSKAEYRFADIFSECKELKAVLLIHYSAILFYVSRLCLLKEVELPRTVSFSGKGSEYLSLVFPSNNDLKGFTQKMLGAFAGKPTRNDFTIERSKEPKVITAKGSAHFANEQINQKETAWEDDVQSDNKEKHLTLREVGYKGFKDFKLETAALTYASLSEGEKYYTDIMNNLSEFFNLLFDNQDLCGLINKRLELKDFARYKQFFIPKNVNILREGKLRDSFRSTLSNLDSSDTISDSPFFFALNYSLIELSKQIANA